MCACNLASLSAKRTVHAVCCQVVMMGFSIGGYITAAFAARHQDLVTGVVLVGCCNDTHTFMWRLIGRLAELVYAVCSPKTKSQVWWA